MEKNKLIQIINALDSIEYHLEGIDQTVAELCENIPQDELLYTPIKFHVEFIKLNIVAITKQIKTKIKTLHKEIIIRRERKIVLMAVEKLMGQYPGFNR